jgi:1,4-dihydroxy-2-naphthoate octaprenyltransferase
MSPPVALRFGLASLVVTIAAGIYFFLVRGWGILLVGLPGLLLVGLYTQYLTRFPLLCLLAPGLGFGPCMVLGMYYVLQGFYDWTAVAASLIPGFLVSNLLLLNQFPDVETDRRAGRRHLPVVLGKSRSARVYSLLALTTYLWLILKLLLVPTTSAGPAHTCGKDAAGIKMIPRRR